MRLRKLYYTGLLLALAVSSAGAFDVSYGAEADFVSDYVWRAMKFSKGFVCQPYAYVSMYGITPAVWANVQLQDEHNSLDEIDFMLSYSHSFADLSVEAGYVYYYLPDFKFEEPEGVENPKIGTVDFLDTHDLFFVLSYPVLPPLSVYSNHYVTVGGNPGAYYGDIGLGFDPSLTEYLDLSAYFEAGFGSCKFNDYNLGQDKFALNLIEAGVSATFSFLDMLYVRPHLGYTTLIDGDLRDAAGEGNTAFWFGGAAVGFER
jgi:hypothetical protein